MAVLTMMDGAIVADRPGLIRNAEPTVWERNYEALLDRRISPIAIGLVLSGACRTWMIANAVALVGWADAHRALTRNEALAAGQMRNLILAA